MPNFRRRKWALHNCCSSSQHPPLVMEYAMLGEFFRPAIRHTSNYFFLCPIPCHPTPSHILCRPPTPLAFGFFLCAGADGLGQGAEPVGVGVRHHRRPRRLPADALQRQGHGPQPRAADGRILFEILIHTFPGDHYYPFKWNANKSIPPFNHSFSGFFESSHSSTKMPSLPSAASMKAGLSSQ